MATTRAGLILGVLALTLAIAAYAGPRAGMLVLLGVLIGLVMEGLRLGFAGPWRRILTDRDGRGFVAQLVAIGLTAAIAMPLLAAAPDELIGAHAPVGVGMILGAFVFGFCMQIVMGCGSGTLLNAGSGNAAGALALVFFIPGSFLGTLHLGWWADLGSLPLITLQGIAGPTGGLILTLMGLVAVAALVMARADPGKRVPPLSLWLAAALLALLAAGNLALAGQPWGIVYGLGLWGAKLAQAGGMDVAATAFWSAPANAERLASSIFTDVTSLTNIGLIVGAVAVMRWRAAVSPQIGQLRAGTWVAIAISGLILGYSSRIAFGCNVGAFFSGISTGSLHGWVWLVAGFAGSALATRTRGAFGLPAGAQPAARAA